MKKKQKQFETLDEALREGLSNPETRHVASELLKDIKSSLRQMYDSATPLAEELLKHGIVWNPEYVLDGLFGTEYEPKLVKSILTSIFTIPDEDVKTKIVRLLGHTTLPYDGTILIDLFNQSASRKLKQEIVTILVNTDSGTEWWLRQIMMLPEYGEYRKTAVALSDLLKDREGLNCILMQVFDDIPSAAVDPLGKLGGQKELSFLQDRLSRIEQYPIDELQHDLKARISRSIRAIEKRLGCQGN